MTTPDAPGAPITVPPPPAKSNEFQPSDEIGALVRFAVHSYDPNAMTPWGARPEATCTVDILDGSHLAGRTFGPMKLSGKMLAPQLGQYVGGVAYGRLAEQPGNNANPAVYLAGLRQGDEDMINRWRAAHADGAGQPPGQQPQQGQPAPTQQPYGQAQPGYGQPPAQQQPYPQQPQQQQPPAQPYPQQPPPQYPPQPPAYQPPTYGQPQQQPPQQPPPF
jgi:hypothetical protein